MPDNSKLIAELEAEDGNRLPTPPIGETVIWYEAGNLNEPRAAIVTKIEAPGRVALTIFGYRSHPSHKEGVFHYTHEIHKTPSNPTTVRCGCFSYLRELAEVSPVKPPGADYELHRKDIKKRRDNAMKDHTPPDAVAAKK